MDDATTLLFVYGTLKQGYGNNRRLRRAPFQGNAISIEADYLMQEIGFPILWQRDKKDVGVRASGAQVTGEIYKITPQQLVSCDQLESNGYMYTRQERRFKITKRGGMEVTAWVYLWNLDRDHDWIEPVDGVLTWDREGRRKVL